MACKIEGNAKETDSRLDIEESVLKSGSLQENVLKLNWII